jgi:neurotransmitter:Na+ symporter, NSS family
MKQHEHWSSGFTFFLATTGGAVGLGNIWRFPYIVGENGGAAFILIYLAFVIVLGIPLMMSEFMLGRYGRQSPVNSMALISERESGSRHWKLLGVSVVVTPLLVLSFYSVVAGWTINYVIGSASGALADVTGESSAQAFSQLNESPGQLIFFQALILVATIFIVARGVKKGLEKAVEWLMPMLFFILLALTLYSLSIGDAGAAIDFLFTPDFSVVTPEIMLLAAGQAFFSLSLGTGSAMTYGAYLPKNVSILKMACYVAAADVSVAILSGLAIFPIVFAAGLEPSEGPGLVFVTAPIVFSQIAAGQFFGTLFFVLLLAATVTTTISMLEPLVCFLEEKYSLKRPRLALYSGCGVWMMGITAALSFNVWKDFTPLGHISIFAEKTVFDLLEFFSVNIFIPINGLLITLFAGWVLTKSSAAEELKIEQSWLFSAWRYLVRYFVPVALLLLLVLNLLS